jgi:hypothetical protein
MEYTQVDHSHVVPRGYLRNFADEDEKLVLHLVDSGKTVPRASVNDVAVRKRFYSRERSDGSRIDDVEWSLSHIERAAPRVLRGIRELWPLSEDDRKILGEFCGLQMVRGPRWHEGYRERTEAFIEKWEENEGFEDFTKSGGPSAEEVRKLNEEHFQSDTQRLVRMLSLSLKAASIFGSMNWSLVTFDSAALVSSDHPVVGWPIVVRAQEPQPIDLYKIGLANMLEIRIPISPREAVLMAWLDDEGNRVAPIPGARHHAANLNAFTVASADKQWFHLPGPTPRVGSGRLMPLSPELLSSYDAPAAARSQLRAMASELARKRVGQSVGDNSYDIATLTKRPRHIIER